MDSEIGHVDAEVARSWTRRFTLHVRRGDAHATFEDWLGSHVRPLQFRGGVAVMNVTDELKSAVSVVPLRARHHTLVCGVSAPLRHRRGACTAGEAVRQG